MKSFRSIFLILLVLFSISVAVLAETEDIEYRSSDDHAHFPNEGCASGTHEIFDTGVGEDDPWYIICPNLDTVCESHMDYTGWDNPTEPGCKDSKYDVVSFDSTYVECEENDYSGNGVSLRCKGKTPTGETNTVVQMKGYPHDGGFSDSDHRYAYQNFHIKVKAVPEPVAVDANISAVSSGPSKTAQTSCSGGTGDYTFSITDSPNKGDATISSRTGLITYTPAAKSVGDYDLTYQCKDENDKSDTALVTIAVSAANDPAPVWDDIPDSKGEMVEDENKYLFKLDNFCSDPGETGIQNDRSYLIISETQKDIVDCQIKIKDGTASSTQKWLYCEPKEDKSGISVVTIQCKESSGSKQKAVPNAIVNVDVSSVYDAMSVAPSTTFTVIEDSENYTREIPLNIPESGAEYEFGIKDHHTNFKHIASTLTRPNKNSLDFVYNPPKNFVGEDKWVYQVKDKGNNVMLDGKVLVFTVVNAADAPSIKNSISKTILEDNHLPFQSSWFEGVFEDDDYADSLKEIIITIPEGMKGDLYSSSDGGFSDGTEKTISKNNINNLFFETHDDENNAVNYASFEFRVVDQSGNPSLLSATFTIKVTPVQDAPTLMFTELVWINSNTLETVTIDEDKNVTVGYTTEDVDGEVLGISATSSNEDLVLSSSLIPTLTELELIPIAGAFGTTTITVYLTDGTDTISTSFDLEVSSVNDIPESQNFSASIYEYGTYTFDPDNFAFSDVDVGDVIQNVKILTLPTGGQLKLNSVVYTEELLETGITIPITQIPNLAFVSEYGFLNTTSFNFKVSDGTNYSRAHLFSIAVQPSPYGPNSHPASFGGYPIHATGWACKPGYTLDESALTAAFNLDEICITKENELPIPNIVAPTLVQVGDTVSFSGASSIDPEGAPIASYSWEITPTVNKSGIRTDHVYTNVTDCPLSMCTINLTVTDDEGASASITHSLTLTELEVEELDYTGLRIILDKTYTDGELAYLALLKGGTILADDKMISVDLEGKVISIEPRVSENTDSEPQLSYVPYDGICQQGEELSNTPIDCLKNDGYCSKSQGENQINSPDDCDEGSILGILGILGFVTIIGGGIFFAWKKGLLGSHNLSVGAKPTSTGPSEFKAAPKPAGPETYIKTQRSKGFSNEQIRGALKNKGWDDDKIDEALNASRE